MCERILESERCCSLALPKKTLGNVLWELVRISREIRRCIARREWPLLPGFAINTASAGIFLRVRVWNPRARHRESIEQVGTSPPFGRFQHARFHLERVRSRDLPVHPAHRNARKKARWRKWLCSEKHIAEKFDSLARSEIQEESRGRIDEHSDVFFEAHKG